MINTKSTFSTKSCLRLLLAGLLFGSVGLVSSCGPTETTRTTTEQTTTREIVPPAPAPTSTSVTTTKTQVYTP